MFLQDAKTGMDVKSVCMQKKIDLRITMGEITVNFSSFPIVRIQGFVR